MAEDAQGTGDERSGMRNGLAANRLRHISVHVIEPAPGRYFWVLLEQGTEGRPGSTCSRARSHASTGTMH